MSPKPMPRIAARSIAGGMLLMAGFTLIWAGIASSALPSPLSIPAIVAFGTLSLLVGFGGAQLLLASGKFPAHSSQADRAQSKRIGIAYGAIFGTEALLIGGASGIITATHHDAYLIPTIGLIVGLHFYPMAKVFHRTIDYYLATWVCSVALSSMIMLSQGKITTPTASIVVSLATATATSIYGLYMLRLEQRAIRSLTR
ncbi:MAG TPA: hypothetical protein VMT30_07750 [Candidatus Saccharimonadia bacterium]|nr:hypothetical protein [Candidatus Saccharimonadia bacterium]